MIVAPGVHSIVLKVVVPDGAPQIAQIGFEHVQPYLRSGGAQLINHDGGDNTDEQDDNEDFDEGESGVVLETSSTFFGSNNLHVVSMRSKGREIEGLIN